MTGLRLPLRLARREVRRRPGRTALVALLIALPVAGMVLATVTIHTGRHTQAEEWERQWGQADGVSFGDDAGGFPEAPADARYVSVTSTYLRMRTEDGRRSSVELSDLPLNDPLVSGIHALVNGRAATKPGEVVLSRSVARRLDVRVGDELALDRPKADLVVVGVVEPVGCLGCDYALLAPGQVSALADIRIYGLSSIRLYDLSGVPDADLVALSSSGMSLRALTINQPPPPASSSVRWSLVLGAVALTVVGIVISAAFAVGARRQLVTLGQLSASGAPPNMVRSALVLQGTVTGLLGGVVGVGIAGVALLTGRGVFEGFLDERIHSYSVSVRDVVLAVLIGTTAATLSALIPARTAARIPTLAALAGRRPLAPVSRRLVAGGVVTMAGGLGLLGLAVVGSRAGSDGDLWAFVAVLGGVGELLGACAIAPAIVARLELLAHRLRGSLRLGARSLARNRARTGAVVSAVAAAGALAVAAGALVLGGSQSDAEAQLTVPDDVVMFSLLGYDESSGFNVDVGLPSDEVLAEAREALDGADEHVVRATAITPAGAARDWSVTPLPGASVEDQVAGEALFGSVYERALVADAAVLDAIDAPAEVRDALEEVGLVVLRPFGSAEVSITVPGRDIPLPAEAVHVEHNLGWTSDVLISEAKVEQLHLDVVEHGTLFRTEGDLTQAQIDGLEDLQSDFGFTSENRNLNVQWQYRDSGPTPLQIELMLTGIALVFSLFVVGVSLALAAAESKDERDILTIAGAPPGALARSAGARAWLLAAIGGAMAIPVGFLPVIVFSYASHDQYVDERFPLVFPTRTVLLLVLVVPAIVAAASLASSAMAQRLRPLRVSTATFE